MFGIDNPLELLLFQAGNAQQLSKEMGITAKTIRKHQVNYKPQPGMHKAFCDQVEFLFDQEPTTYSEELMKDMVVKLLKHWRSKAYVTELRS